MKSWDDCNKPHRLAKKFLGITGDFSKKNFFAVYSFFKKQQETTLNLLYEYLCSLNGKHKITMADLFKQAEEWNTRSKVKHITHSNVTDYLELLGGTR